MPDHAANIVDLSLSNLPVSDKLQLSEDQVLRIFVVDKLSANKAVLFFNGNSFFAESDIPLEKGQSLIAKVKSLNPSLVLSLIPDNKAASQAQNADMLIKDQLRSMNIIPKAEILNAARAFQNEGIPLKQDVFLKFLDEMSNLNLKNPQDIQMAVKIFKISLPVTPELISRFREFFSPQNTSLPALNEGISMMNRDIASLNSSGHLNLQSVAKNIENTADSALVKPDDSSSEILSKLRTSIDFSGISFEKKLVGELFKNMFDSQIFLKEYDNILKFTSEMKSEITGRIELNSPYSAILKAQINNIQDFESRLAALYQKISPEFTAGQMPEPVVGSGLHPAQLQAGWNLSEAQLFVKLIYSAEKILSAVQDILKQSDGRAMESNELLLKLSGQLKESVINMFNSEKFKRSERIVFGEDGVMPAKPKEASLSPYTDMKDSTGHAETSFMKYFRHPGLNMAVNLKEELFRMEEQIRESMSLKDTDKHTAAASGYEHVMSKINKDTSDMINSIYREQIASVQDENSQRIGHFNMYYDDGGKTREMKFFFKEQNISNSAGNGGAKSYLIFFSMELSNIGYFEMNILDLNKKLDISFFSENSGIRDFFESESKELASKINTPPVSSVTLRVGVPKRSTASDNSKNSVSSVQSSLEQKGLIDIII